MTLHELYDSKGHMHYNTDKAMHEYLKVYDKLFLPYKDQAINVFEVGYASGGSAKLFVDYFENAQVRCIDINALLIEMTYNIFNRYSRRLKVEHKDANTLNAEYFKDFIPTIAIDDGSHKISDQINFIATVYPVLAPGGLLIVEDIQNPDENLMYFEELGIPMEVYDLRSKKDSDDVLLVFKKPMND